MLDLSLLYTQELLLEGLGAHMSCQELNLGQSLARPGKCPICCTNSLAAGTYVTEGEESKAEKTVQLENAWIL